MVWLMATSGKGMEISGTFARRNQKIYMDLTFTNRAMQPLRGFAIQFNKNRLFLQAWKDIPAENEVQYNIENVKALSPDGICTKLEQNNVYTVARRNVESQELLYHSMKLTNGIWVLSELKLQPNNSSMTLSLKSRNTVVVDSINQAFVTILQA
ncbi:Beta2-adaptin appendage, sub-domain protein [Trichinella nativa]|uniref:Beta2-adaptin appendage, sub-domain protein n=1 Tax=Trichinella nativa TaxID=6335 RepID=A0A1Y3EYL8_9BILA|nr:Beta2-adaptin appendage, sub-domain protein [Trichinella nativa]